MWTARTCAAFTRSAIPGRSSLASGASAERLQPPPTRPAKRFYGSAMSERLDVLKTYKLFIDGKFPRSESGRTVEIQAGELRAHLGRASRKDLREAIEAARKAQPGWAAATAYNRGQILYRMAEMVEGKSDEFAAILAALSVPARTAASRGKKPVSKGSNATRKSQSTPSAHDEVAASIDRLVAFAGWADKYAQVLGSNNPVAGPYYNFTAPEPAGVVACLSGESRPLLGLISVLAPVLAAGNAAVCLGGPGAGGLVASVLGEVCATSDVPPGVVNILTGDRSELIPWIAGHRDIDAVHAAGLSIEELTALRLGTAENLKRVTHRDVHDWFDARECHSPAWFEGLVEYKTVWHPAST